MCLTKLKEAAEYAAKKKDLRDFLVGAIGERMDGVTVYSRNGSALNKTPEIHAESRLCRKLGKNAPVVYVARYSKNNGELAMAKPCEHCMNILKAFKVKLVVYSTGPDSFERIEL